MSQSATSQFHGVLGAFNDPDHLKAAMQAIREQGYDRVDAMTPFPVEGVAELTGYRKTRLPWIMLAGFVVGSAGIYGLQLYSVLVDYPINVGGRPLNSWPAFLVPAFECGILGAALSGFVAMLAGNGLPRLYHPVFNAEIFSFAGKDQFYLLVEGHNAQFDREKVERELRRLGAQAVERVEP